MIEVQLMQLQKTRRLEDPNLCFRVGGIDHEKPQALGDLSCGPTKRSGNDCFKCV